MSLEPTPKPSDVIQAQIATYATERVPEGKTYIFDNLGKLATGRPEDISTIIEAGSGDTGTWTSTATTSATTEGYNSFLQSVGGSNYEPIQGRVELLRAYGRFAPAINELKTDLTNPDTQKEHPAFVGNGTNARAFTIHVDEKDYVVRIPTTDKISADSVDSHLAAAISSKGIPHVEQIVAASYEDGVTVAERIPGIQAGDLTKEDVEHITNKQLDDLADMLIAVNRHGLIIDPRPNNFLYDPEAGYGLVDLSSNKEAWKGAKAQSLSDAVGIAPTMIEQSGFFGDEKRNRAKDIDDYAQDVEMKKANLDVLERYRAIVESKLTGDDLAGALAKIDYRIEDARDYIALYSDPEYVAEDIAYWNGRKN